MNYQFGLEHEVAFVDETGQFADFSNSHFERFEAIVAALPEYDADYPQLRIGDAGIKRKRWYIEGYERFSETGELLGCAPKGIEIRTTIHPTIVGAVVELQSSFDQLRAVAQRHGLRPALVSFNPNHAEFLPQPPLNTYESRRRESSAEKRTAHIPMLTYGPDLNFSVIGMSTAELIRAGQKLTYYSPAIVPFSFSSPFHEGKLWDGLSVRTALRTGARPAAMVFVEHHQDLIESVPSLTKPARLAAEVGRIEFKACDSCGNFALYAGLLALVKGLVLDSSLPGLATIPDAKAHQHSAQLGFTDAALRQQAIALLQAAEASLDSAEQALLLPLWRLVAQPFCQAQRMIEQWQEGQSLAQVMTQGYESVSPFAPVERQNTVPSLARVRGGTPPGRC